jgi:hypothetical protein
MQIAVVAVTIAPSSALHHAPTVRAKTTPPAKTIK